MTKHRHRWRQTWVTGGGGKLAIQKLGEQCRCGERREREATPQESKKLTREWKQTTKNCKEIHRVWHAFCKRFKSYKKVPYDFGQGKKKQRYFGVAEGWKYTGYDFMQKARKFAERFPRDIFVHGIDDSYHTSSDIVFVLHRRRGEFFGTTCVVITQCDGQPPVEFFLYPSHLKEMFPTLTRLRRLGQRSLD